MVPLSIYAAVYTSPAVSPVNFLCSFFFENGQLSLKTGICGGWPIQGGKIFNPRGPCEAGILLTVAENSDCFLLDPALS